MVWPSPERATLEVFSGTLDVPQRPPGAADARLAPFHAPETAPPEQPTILQRDGARIERIDRIGLELGAQGSSRYHVEEDDPLSATAELRRTLTMAREGWRIRIETRLHLSCTRTDFLLRGGLTAWEGDDEVCRREWDCAIPRECV